MEMIDFYTRLRKDPFVQFFRREGIIRELTARLFIYKDHVNMALYNNMRKAGRQRDEMFLCTLADDDAMDIAYKAVMATKSYYGPFDHMMYPSPLKFCHRMKKRDYRKYKAGFENIHIFMGQEWRMQENPQEAGKEIFGYHHRKKNLEMLSMCKDLLRRHYAGERWENIARAVFRNDLSWFTANWGRTRLLDEEVRDFSNHFRYQGQINGIKAKVVLIAAQRRKYDMEMVEEGFMNERSLRMSSASRDYHMEDLVRH